MFCITNLMYSLLRYFMYIYKYMKESQSSTLRHYMAKDEDQNQKIDHRERNEASPVKRFKIVQ